MNDTTTRSPRSDAGIGRRLRTQLSAVGVVALKEMRELLRDVRSMMITIAVPLVLFPGLFLILETNIESQQTIRESLRTVAVSGSWTLPDTYTAIDGGKETVIAGDAIVAIDRRGTIHYNDRSELSTVTAQELQSALLYAHTDPTDTEPASPPNPFPLVPVIRIDEDALPGANLALAAVVPLFLLLAVTVSSLPAALDLGAGEKQRESLEFLLASTERRGALFVGKAVAATILGYLGTAAFVSGSLIAHMLVPTLLGESGSLPFSFNMIAGLVGSVALVGTVIATIQLALSLLARSPREAQALFLPFLVIVSGMGYTALLTDIWYTPQWMFLVPILNIGILLKGLSLEATVQIPVLWIVVENFALLAVLAFLGKRILLSEWVLRRS